MSEQATVLLVDDNRDMREYVTRLLSPGFRVVAAEDGVQALELLDSGLRPDLVLSDVMMPRLDGFGLLKALRDRPPTEATPVIFLSARAGEEARIEESLMSAQMIISSSPSVPANSSRAWTRISV